MQGLERKEDRINYIINLAWEIFFNRVVTGRIRLNKESSMQLHYSSILNELGELMCIYPDEIFTIELESKYERKNIDIILGYGDTRAAIELKCFRKRNRATDIDMYDALRDIERLFSYNNFQLRKFICLSDNPYYAHGRHSGHATYVSIRNGKTYKKDVPIKPSWVGKWADKSRDKTIIFDRDISFNWINKNEWYYLIIDI